MEKTKILVGYASCGIAAGAKNVYNLLSDIQKTEDLQFELKITGCIGMCYREPLIEVIDDTGSYLYCEVDEKRVTEIINKHIKNQEPIKDYIVKTSIFKTDDDKFFDKQVKIALRNCGIINPENIDEYIEQGGYEAIKQILKNKIPQEQIIQEVLDSGIRGRGGGGFSTGLKWKIAFNTKTDVKYVICNADEGDPGAFMDRSLLESDPHSVLEGMTIGAYAIGAQQGLIYCRAEYPLAVKRLNIAIKQARENGFLGENCFGTESFNFDLHIKEGAGAFVCGEETALITSVEGKRGVPKPRPPFPAVSGLYNKPTVINNVETLANIPYVIHKGWQEFAKYGTEKSKGTKIFALAGKINHGGLVEVPMGITINEIIYEIGGGIKDGKQFKGVQLGGPSGGCIPAYLGDTIIDFDSLTATGAIMGSGGMVVMDETTCMVDIAKFFLDFTQKESCGKCVPCRLGTKQMLNILTNITQNKAKEEDIQILEVIAKTVKATSLCGLGQTAPNPVLTTIRYFLDEYKDHINGKCTAKVCKDLIRFNIIEDKCPGCHICFKSCPVNAIVGKPKEVHHIIQDKCTKCRMCYEKCPPKFSAVEILSGKN